MYYLFVVLAVLSRASLGMSGLREKHPYVCYKGRALFAGTAPYVTVMYSQRESANGTGAAFLAVRPVKCDPFFTPRGHHSCSCDECSDCISPARGVCTGMTNTRALSLISGRASRETLIITLIYFCIYSDKN